MTPKQAKESSMFHENGTCYLLRGPRGGLQFSFTSWRRNGTTKLWKTRPDDFVIPIKTGFRGPYSYLTHLSIEYYHLPSECEVFKELAKKTRPAIYISYYDANRKSKSMEVIAES